MTTRMIAKPSQRAFLAAIAQATLARAAIVNTDFSTLPPYCNGAIPPGIRSRQIANVNGMNVHILEAGYESPGRPAVLLLHGFPELAWSWRKVMPSLAAAGYHVIAPDQRGYGRTLGWDDSYDADADPFRILNHDARRHRAGLRAGPPFGSAGHWVQQEQPEQVSAPLVQFLRYHA